MKSEEKNMVNIKGLDKMRVLKALYDNSEKGYGEFLRIAPDLSGDEFDERLYDRDCGEGAAQRAVDSIRAEKEGSKDTAGNTGGEKKELTMEEKAELSRTTIIKILEMLKELPPDVSAATCTMLKMTLPGPMGGMAGLMMMGGPFSPSALFRSVERPMGWPTGMGPRGRFG